MSKSVKGTRTEQNLLKAFAGESQARTRYTFFASVAKKEGYEPAGILRAEERQLLTEFFYRTSPDSLNGSGLFIQSRAFFGWTGRTGDMRMKSDNKALSTETGTENPK